ncbi:MAG: hypothetical protein M1273_08740 [Deltaproteobacteria bacterium]|nr:hypothetical protein [Deltaproteobacteria bacterium]
MKKQAAKCGKLTKAPVINIASGNINKKELSEEEAIKYLMEVAEVSRKAGRTAVKGERAKLKALGILED